MKVHTVVVGLLLATGPASSVPAAGLEVVPSGDGIRVRVAKQGLFAGFAHDHDFEVTRWRGTANVPEDDPGRVSVELVLDADSLRDHEKGLSESDRRKVEAQSSGTEVLDAAHYPTITFRSESTSLFASGADGLERGTMHGTLTLRDQEHPVDATFEAVHEGDRWHVRGRARFLQSQFGIKPFSGFGGTVGVKDEVEVTFALTVQPGARNEEEEAAGQGASP